MGPRVDVVAVKDTFSLLRTEVGAGVDAFVVLGELRAGLTERTDGRSIGVHARYQPNRSTGTCLPRPRPTRPGLVKEANEPKDFLWEAGHRPGIRRRHERVGIPARNSRKMQRGPR